MKREAAKPRGRTLFRNTDMFAHGDRGIADLVDRDPEIVFADAEMPGPVANLDLVMHRNVTAVAFALARQNIAHDYVIPV